MKKVSLIKGQFCGILFMVVANLLGTACGTLDSKELTTQGMFADLLVGQNEEGKLYFDASIFPGDKKSTTYVDLSDGDVLKVVQGEHNLDLSRQKDALTNAITYNSEKASADVMAKFDVSKEFVFQLVRSEESGKSALESKATLPIKMDIKSPEAKSTFNSEDDDLLITWAENSADRIVLDLKGDCIIDYHKEIKSDEAQFEIDKQSLILIANKSTCDVNLTLSRVKDGSIDSNFKDGHIRGKQTDVRSFVLDNTAPVADDS